jgi:hypothetical protein
VTSNDGRRRTPTDDSTRRPAQPIFTTTQTLVLEAAEQRYADADLCVPVSIFSSRLSGLQALVRYLHERQQLSFSEIAALLNRSPKTIWATYSAAGKVQFSYQEGSLTIPVATFAARELSVLETLVTYLRTLGFSNIDTARTLALDPRTTWTVSRRAEKKGVRL